VFGDSGVEIAFADPGVFGEVVDDSVTDVDVVVDEGEAFVFAGAADYGDAREGIDDRSDGGAVAFGVYFDLRAADRDEFGVEGDNGPFDWSFLRECERSICFHWVGTVAV